jgi:hypothetical protein
LTGPTLDSKLAFSRDLEPERLTTTDLDHGNEILSIFSLPKSMKHSVAAGAMLLSEDLKIKGFN